MPFNVDDSSGQLWQRIIGLGETSVRKSYYPQLQQRLADLERFRALLDQSIDPIFTVAVPSGKIWDATASLETVTGFSHEQILEKTVFDLLPKIEDVSDFWNAETISAGSRRIFVTSLRAASDREIPVEVSLSLQTFSDEWHLVIVVREISARLAAEEEIQRQLRRLAGLHYIDLSITNSRSINETLGLVLEIAERELRVDASAIMRFVPETGDLHALAWRGLPGPLSMAYCLDSFSPHYRERVVLSGVEAIRQHSKCERLGDLERYQTYVGMPLITQNEMKGYLELYFEKRTHLPGEWYTFMETLATQAAIAIDSFDLLLGLKDKNRQLEDAYEATLEGWALALELRERETAEHTHRVMDMTVKMAQELGFSDTELVNIRRGALLHDIGKMGVPDHILLKPGPLTDDEWQIMRQHPIYARNMLEPIVFLRPVIDIPYCHHERWDGSGYPMGLKGKEIPLSARVFSIVDVWDALLSDRPYRPAWLHKDVLAYIRSLSGKAFDPQVVDVFMRIVGENG